MSCAICFEDITAATGRVELSCSHSFHYGCLTNWFGNQMAKDIEESCPCCRHVANQHERLPDIDIESESSATGEQFLESLENEQNLAQHVANERAQTKFETLRHSLSKEDFEAYAATRINAVVRGYWWRKNWLEHRYLNEQLALVRRRVRRVTVDLVRSSRQVKFHLPSVTMSRRKWLNTVATKIQAVVRGWIGRKNSLYEIAKGLQISWNLSDDGWTRTVHWDGVGLEPQAMAFQRHCCAKKIQTAWRSRVVQVGIED
jgi:hypothetical protein